MSTKLCWICKTTPIESAEHKLKKSDLVRLHGSGTYTDNQELLHLTDGVYRKIRGPNASIIKYKKSLCSRCNDTFSQPFDFAYDQFINWVSTHPQEILQRRLLDFYAIYGDEFQQGQLKLFKYFAKLFGCRLADGGLDIPQDVSELLYLESFRTGLRISFAISEAMLKLPEESQLIFNLGDLYGSNLATPQPIYTWSQTMKWLNIFFWYNFSPIPELGPYWVADSRYLYFGCADIAGSLNNSKLIQDILRVNNQWIEIWTN